MSFIRGDLGAHQEKTLNFINRKADDDDKSLRRVSKTKCTLFGYKLRIEVLPLTRVGQLVQNIIQHAGTIGSSSAFMIAGEFLLRLQVNNIPNLLPASHTSRPKL